VTGRVRLRELESRDFDALREMDADAEVQFWRGAMTITPEDTRRFLDQVMLERQAAPRPRYVFGITVPPDDSVIGTCWLILTYPDWLGAEIGYQLNRRAWGQGYATETVRAVLEFGFKRLNLHRIWARVNPPNAPSWRVLEKVGMRREAELKECELAAGEWRDLYLYAMLAKEWKS
jgi:RimJ/RimL family protein N-acetyltransferase